MSGTRETVITDLEAQYRSKNVITIFRNGAIMMNPYHFSMGGENAFANQALAMSLMNKIYDTSIEEQENLADELGKQNDAAGPYMVWEAFVTGHANIYRALGAFKRTAGPEGWDSAVDNYTSGRLNDVFNASSSDKADAVTAWLEEFKDESALLAFRASAKGDEAVLNHLMASGQELISEDDLSLVPLHAACFNGQLGAAQILLKSGFDINVLDDAGGTPLMRAAAGGRTEVVSWLLENGADPHARESRSGSYSAFEIGAKHTGVVRKLLDSGVGWSGTAMAAAASHGNEKVFNMLVTEGNFSVAYPLGPAASIAEPLVLSEDQRQAVTDSLRHLGAGTASSTTMATWLLHHVAISRDEDGYMLNKADNEIQEIIEDCLSRGIAHDDLALVELLLPYILANPPPSQPERQALDTINILLVSAASHNALSTARFLLNSHFANSSALVGPTSVSPLSVAAANDHTPMIHLLVSEFKADIHALADGRTALWTAIWNQQEAATRLLLELGGPVSGIHAEIEVGLRRVWIAAFVASKAQNEGGQGDASGDSGEQTGESGGEVTLVAWMDPRWVYDSEWDERSQEREQVRFLCLEYPDGFSGDIEIRK